MSNKKKDNIVPIEAAQKGKNFEIPSHSLEKLLEKVLNDIKVMPKNEVELKIKHDKLCSIINQLVAKEKGLVDDFNRAENINQGIVISILEIAGTNGIVIPSESLMVNTLTKKLRYIEGVNELTIIVEEKNKE